MRHDFVIGLGSNLGDRGVYLARAVEQIAALPRAAAQRVSPVYETEPIGPAQPLYLNAALRVSCDESAHWLLDRLLGIERALGRIRDVRWGPRVVDLDILWGEECVASERLSVPHAHLRARAFALAPLLDVAPELAPAYAAALQAAGGVPRRRGALDFDAVHGTCVYAV